MLALIICLAAVISVIILSDSDGFWAAISIIAGALGLRFLAGVNVFPEGFAIRDYFGYIVLYLLVGVLWSVVKWYFYVNDRAREHKRRKAKFGSQYSERGYGQITVPQVNEHKSDIIRWMTYWPFSLIFTLINDPFRRLFEFIYRQIHDSLQAMANRAFQD